MCISGQSTGELRRALYNTGRFSSPVLLLIGSNDLKKVSKLLLIIIFLKKWLCHITFTFFSEGGIQYYAGKYAPHFSKAVPTGSDRQGLNCADPHRGYGVMQNIGLISGP